MKKILTGLAVLAVLIGAACAGDVGQKAYLNIAWPTTYTNGTFYTGNTTTNGFDLTAYNGIGKLLVFVSGDQGTAASTNTDAIVLQHSALETGTYSTVSALTAYMPSLTTTATVTAVTVDLETLKNWVRIGVTSVATGGTNCSHTVGAVLVCPQKND